eukprot:1974368-Amphidinium_carterae.2
MLLQVAATSAPFWTTLLSSVGGLKLTGDWDTTIPQAGAQQVVRWVTLCPLWTLAAIAFQCT